jgi:hypothetical protein
MNGFPFFRSAKFISRGTFDEGPNRNSVIGRNPVGSLISRPWHEPSSLQNQTITRHSISQTGKKVTVRLIQGLIPIYNPGSSAHNQA